ncbi:sugar ABC transporter permease [Streptomyces sp. CB01635]|uniref:carbohydrate ABC transporter permease n=1 Tax=unclassified Streptomyces TaxID=2593676 RepID=UPI000C277798|nr:MULTISPECIES: carbohydrate ABC transporter permease [unclassified Streptomyces]PJN11162.1 sugar ABC transporter permease [Streptomyces sp. CB01635]WSE03363.1 carbohydrate ABC transporter permease [Streptomyces sp. NBC_01445]
MNRYRGSVLGSAATYLVLCLLSVVFLIPFYVLLRNAFMTTPEVTATDWHWLPSALSWDTFSALFNNPERPFGRSLANSLLIAVISAPVSTLLASMAGYALARINVPGRGVVLSLIVGTLMIPQAVTFLPTFVVVGSMGGVNTMWGLIAPGLFNAFAVVLFRSFYLSFPAEIEEAGRLDGLSYLGVYGRIILPNSVTMIASLGALSFIEAWNSFLWPLMIGQDPESWTVQIALSSFLTSQTVNLPELFAGTVVAILPLVIMFLVAQRHIVQGIAMSGLKS